MPENLRTNNTPSTSENKPGFDKKSDEALPGYPHYPPGEDIMNPANGFEKTAADSENLTRSGRFVERSRAEATGESNTEDYDDLGIVSGTEADVTSDDLLILGAREGDQDLGDDELVRGKIQPIGGADEELDIPGTELDDENEVLGEEDEENNYYSLGGDNHENLEEDQA
jgi:hypothetical protein